jgi:hypothetical protein
MPSERKMPDSVVDASAVAFSNGDIAARKPGNLLDRRLTVLEQVANGQRRLRYNPKLRSEYLQIIREHRNDVIELFFAALADRGVFVARNTLSRQHHATATARCRWPTHDQHLLAAAMGGDNPTIFVTEQRLADCAARIATAFGIRVEHLL